MYFLGWRCTFRSLQNADFQPLEGLAGQLLQRAERGGLGEESPAGQRDAGRTVLLRG